MWKTYGMFLGTMPKNEGGVIGECCDRGNPWTLLSKKVSIKFTYYCTVQQQTSRQTQRDEAMIEKIGANFEG